MSLCIALAYAVGKGFKSAYDDVQQKRARKEEERRRSLGEEMDLYGTYPPGWPDHVEPRKKRSLKKQLSLRKRKSGSNRREHEQEQGYALPFGHPDYDFESPPQLRARHPSLGISDEARASIQARADRNVRRAQRMADYGLAVSMVRARRNRMDHIHRIPENVDPPPAYNPAEPRLPSYERSLESGGEIDVGGRSIVRLESPEAG
ncbi:hypothetical protein CPC08DRAFT_721539 [Agrocybe pediades]|nr:hypothetical protein CPC08DRAFT_721539 [Agrocybe pediades]